MYSSDLQEVVAALANEWGIHDPSVLVGRRLKNHDLSRVRQEIWRQLAAKRVPQNIIAEVFGVSRSAVCVALSRPRKNLCPHCMGTMSPLPSKAAVPRPEKKRDDASSQKPSDFVSYPTYLGYSVAEKGGLTPEQRHSMILRILSNNLTTPERARFPDWGEPSSRERVDALSAFLKMRITRGLESNMFGPVKKWVDDLVFLRDQSPALTCS